MLRCHNPYYSAQSAFNLNMATAGKKKEGLAGLRKKSQDIIYQQILYFPIFFFRGVNMFAMLTGKLPYTAEPFHITTLYNKMKTNDMNPIPDHLSAGKFF